MRLVWAVREITPKLLHDSTTLDPGFAMDPQTLAVLRSSLTQLLASDVDLAAVFYARLFERAPELRRLFKADVTSQHKKLFAALAQVVIWADHPLELTGYLLRMGERHVRYGTLPEHYDIVGDALVWALERTLGPDFTPATRAAWTLAFSVVAQFMREGALGVSSSQRSAASPALLEPVGGLAR